MLHAIANFDCNFANFNTSTKRIFDYEDIKGEAHEIKAKNINPYLIDAKDILIEKKSNPICNVPKMSFGNMPLDGGHLLLSDDASTLLNRCGQPMTDHFHQ